MSATAAIAAASVAVKLGQSYVEGIKEESAARAALDQLNLNNEEIQEVMEYWATNVADSNQSLIDRGDRALDDIEDFRFTESDPYTRDTFVADDIYTDPSYQFRFDAGQDALEASAANSGNLFSGATAEAIVDYGQNAASQEYADQYARFSDEEDSEEAQYNTEAARQFALEQAELLRLSGMGDQGVNANSAVNAAAGTAASSYANALSGTGSATAGLEGLISSNTASTVATGMGAASDGLDAWAQYKLNSGT